MMRPLRVGVLGCADVARRLVIPAMRQVDGIEIVAISSRDASKAKDFASLFSCEAVHGYASLVDRDDINLVYVPLPTGLHAEWVVKCLERGKHVLVEKSMSLSLRDAETLVGCARRNMVLLKENYMFAYHAQQQAVRRLMASRVGTVRLFRASFGFPPLPSGNFRYDAALGGGALLDCGGYVLKAIEVFFPGAKATVQSAALTNSNSGVDIAGAAMLAVESDGIVFPAQVAFGFDHRYQCSIEVWGSNARLYTDRTFTAGPGVGPSAFLDTPEGTERIGLPADNHFRNLLEHTVSLVASGIHEIEYEQLLRQASLQSRVRDIAKESVGG
jgi:NDP-hexose-3-ketoreductase